MLLFICWMFERSRSTALLLVLKTACARLHIKKRPTSKPDQLYETLYILPFEIAFHVEQVTTSPRQHAVSCNCVCVCARVWFHLCACVYVATNKYEPVGIHGRNRRRHEAFDVAEFHFYAVEVSSKYKSKSLHKMKSLKVDHKVAV